MRPSTLRAAAALVPLLALAPAPEQPRFAPQEGARVRRTIEQSMALTLESMEMRVDGEELPEGLFEPPEMELEQEERMVLVDTYVRVGEGRALELVRSYETLEGESRERIVGPDGEGGDERTPRSSPLEGHAVRFTWDEDEEEYATAFAGEEGDAELLEGLDEDLDLRGFLPPREVAEGDTWDVPLAAMRAVLLPGGNQKLDDEGDEPDVDADRQIIENLAGDVRATWGGVREVDGRRAGVIALRVDVRSHAMDDLEDEGGDGEQRFEFEQESDGELLWDLEAGRALSLDLAGPLRVRIATTSTIEADEGALDFAQTSVLAGTQRVAWRLEAEE